MADAINSFGLSLTFQATGAPVAVPIVSVLDVGPPPEVAETIKFTPIDGANAGKERVIPGKDSAQQTTVKVVYSAASHATLCGLRRLRGVWLLTLSDGSQMTGSGQLLKVAVDSISDTALMTSSLTFDMDAGFKFVPVLAATGAAATTVGGVVTDLRGSWVPTTATNNGQPVYAKAGSTWKLWFDGLEIHGWVLSSLVGTAGVAYWVRESMTDPTGAYAPSGTAGGALTVAF
jgi:hypothetical protein